MEYKEKTDDDDEMNDSPIEAVRLTVPTTDDPTLPVLTFRTWLIGPITCIFLAFITQFLSFRQNPITIDSSCFTILTLVTGKLMAAILPTKPIRIPITNWTFSMNPGPFNIKEHVVLNILVGSGLDNSFPLVIVTITKAFYHKNISFWASFVLIQTTQMVGYGFAGIFMKFLVNSPHMWWPSSLLDVSLYRFASETAYVTYFILYHARESWVIFKQALKGKDQFNDVHNRLMKSYKPIPHWWFYMIVVPMITLALINSIYSRTDFQLPYWGVLLGYFFPFILTLPAGVIAATTGQASIDLYGLSQLIMGSLYPGYPLANLAFKSYCFCTLSTTMTIIPELKIGHYMKIPPKSLFIAQIVGSFILYSTSLSTVWWLLASVESICDQKKLPIGSPWTCPSEHRIFSSTMVWGGVGPTHVFAPHGQYSNIYYFFLVGVVVTVLAWLLGRMFPEKKWIGLIKVPLIFSAVQVSPPTAAVHFWSWFGVAVIFNLFVYRKYKGWWVKYNYDLCNGLSLGAAFVALLTSFTLGMEGIYGLNWWGLDWDDHCPLATCPTAPGINVDGCPVVR